MLNAVEDVDTAPSGETELEDVIAVDMADIGADASVQVQGVRSAPYMASDGECEAASESEGGGDGMNVAVQEATLDATAALQAALEPMYADIYSADEVSGYAVNFLSCMRGGARTRSQATTAAHQGVLNRSFA